MCVDFFLYIFAQQKRIIMNQKFKIIACINSRNALGKDGQLIWRIKNDMANFKRSTIGNVVIMGRKTYESLPNGLPLSDRVNIVLTRSDDFSVDVGLDNVYIVHSIQDVIELCDAFFSDKELFVIGGAEIYAEFLNLDLVDEMRLTIVKDDSDGDVYFPNFNEDEWYLYFKTLSQVTSKDNVDKTFYYYTYKRKR